jgi:hypothetical protein
MEGFGCDHMKENSISGRVYQYSQLSEKCSKDVNLISGQIELRLMWAQLWFKMPKRQM